MSAKAKNTYTKNFTDAQLERIVRMRYAQLPWPKIAERLNKDWLVKHSPDVYAGLYRRFGTVILEKLQNKQEPHPHEDFTREALGDIKKENKRQKRFFITAVGAAATLHTEGFASIQTFLNENKAELILLPMPAHVRALENQPNHYDPNLKPFLKNFATEYVFNSNIKALELKLNPQQISPLTGLARIRGRSLNAQDPDFEGLIKNYKKTSLIVAHTKQNMETVATGNNSLPRILHSTGTITLPDYQNNRIGRIADDDHTLGGLILDIEDDVFFITQVQINEKTGTFVDKFGKRYHPDGKVTQERSEAFVMGDIHPGMEDQQALDIWGEVWGFTKPKRIFLHDWLDGASISHHLEKKKTTKALRPKHFRTLAAEIEYAKNVLYSVRNMAPKDSECFLVSSNHPEHILKYLDEGRYMKDNDDNYAIGHRMVVDLLDGKDPVKSRLDPKERFTWLDRNQDYLVEGTQVGSHGDIGMNGSKGSIKNNENVYSSSMTAHTHTPCIYHGAYVVGHSSIERHGYNNGPSAWLLCSGQIFKGGHKQLIIAIKGRWKI